MEKYKVSQTVMDSLATWKKTFLENNQVSIFFDTEELEGLPHEVVNWWADSNLSNLENNNRLIAIIQYVNGEEVFEVTEPKFIVRSKRADREGAYIYLSLLDVDNRRTNLYSMAKMPYVGWDTTLNSAFKFDTKEEAEKFANPLMEAVKCTEDLYK